MGTPISAVELRRLSPRLLRLGTTPELAGEALDNVNTTQLPNGAKCFVIENRADYTLDKTSTAPPDGDEIIAPAAGGPGRWIKESSGGGGLLLQACTTSMTENQDLNSGQFIAIEAASVSSPGVRMQCELPSVQPTSGLRCTLYIPSILMVLKVAGVNQVTFQMRLAFPDDSPVPMPVDTPLSSRTANVDLNSIQQTISSDSLEVSYIFPVSALAAIGGPPAGRVQLFVMMSGTTNDNFRLLAGTINGMPFGAGALCLEEIASIVVQ